jgi:hypothetical protein
MQNVAYAVHVTVTKYRGPSGLAHQPRARYNDHDRALAELQGGEFLAVLMRKLSRSQTPLFLLVGGKRSACACRSPPKHMGRGGD